MTRAEIEKEKGAILFHMSCGYSSTDGGPNEYGQFDTCHLAELFYGPIWNSSDASVSRMRRRLQALQKEGVVKNTLSKSWWKLTRPFNMDEWNKEHQGV